MSYYVYILHTSADTLYIGQTKDLDARLHEHKSKSSKSAKYMRYFDSFRLVYTEQVASRSEALKREAVLRRLTREQKDMLIQKYKTTV